MKIYILYFTHLHNHPFCVCVFAEKTGQRLLVTAISNAFADKNGTFLIAIDNKSLLYTSLNEHTN